MYLEHHDTERLKRAEQAASFLCEFFRHDLGPKLFQRLDKFAHDAERAVAQREAPRAEVH